MSDERLKEELENIKEYQADVVVVGAGGAGLRAAIAAAEQGCKVLVICKSLLGKAHTVMAEGGAAAALGNVDDQDNWRVHFRDTMRGGKMHNDWRMAELHAKGSPEEIIQLERWGAVFDRTKDGKISQRNFGGHKYPRLAHVGDRTGLEMIRTLQDVVVYMSDQITVLMEHTVTKLLVEKKMISGVFGYLRETGELFSVKSGAVILATGGLGRAYRITSNSWEYAGDGISMAYRAGAELADMEFIQFHPTGMVYPSSVRGILVTESVRGEGGILLNSENERFMFNYVPEKFKVDYAETEEEANRWQQGDPSARKPPELLTRDVVSRAILSEVQAGRGSPHGGAFLDIASRQNATYIKKKLPSMHHQFKSLAGLDITEEAMEVAPTTHYVMGGIKVDSYSQMTNIKGLFAAGEVATGLHGANRLGGNSLSDLLVFGKLAGEGAVDYLKEYKEGKFNSDLVKEAIFEALVPFSLDNTENPYLLHKELHGIMERYVGIIRTEEGLEKGIEMLDALHERIMLARAPETRVFNPGWHLALDLQKLLDASLASAHAALARKESRGAHTRIDFPETDFELERKVYVLSKSRNKIKLSEDEYPEITSELAELID